MYEYISEKKEEKISNKNTKLAQMKPTLMGKTAVVFRKETFSLFLPPKQVPYMFSTMATYKIQPE